jgi:creatinine amidohydrolase
MSVRNTVWLQELSWEDVKRFKDEEGGPIIIPVGSVEQHGFHMPLGSDSMVAICLSEEAAKKTNVLVTPPLWFGWSPHHLALAGSISIGAEVLIQVLYDILSSMATHGFRKVVVVNGHRIVNIPWMQIAAEKAKRELDMKIALFDPAFMSKEIVGELGFGPVGHAEEIETSHMLHIMPHLVHMERAKDYLPIPTKLYDVDPRSTKDTLCYVPSTAKDIIKTVKDSGGTGGRPTLASAEKGKILHEHLVARLVEVVREFQKDSLKP